MKYCYVHCTFLVRFSPGAKKLFQISPSSLIINSNINTINLK